ncbi:MAG: hypothetical protein ACK52S_01195 [Pirellula sp.]
MDELKRSRDTDISREALRKQQEALASRLTMGNRGNNALNTSDESIVGLAKSELDSASETLIRKRLSQTSSHLPMTRYVMGHDFIREFRGFSETHHFNGYRAHWFDAWYFAEHLKARIASVEKVPWLRDCVKLEQSQIGLELYNPHVSVQRLRYQVHTWQFDRDPSPREKVGLMWVWRFGRFRGLRIR